MSISDVQLKGSWYAVFDEKGKKVKEISQSSVGEYKGNGDEFIILKRGVGMRSIPQKGKN
jgi:hypothetical protein